MLATVSSSPWDSVEGRAKQASLEAEVSTLKAELLGQSAGNGVHTDTGGGASSSSPSYDPASALRAATLTTWQRRTEVCASVSFLAETSVRSPQKVFVFIIYKNVFWVGISKKENV